MVCATGMVCLNDAYFPHSRSDEHVACLTLFGSAFYSYFRESWRFQYRENRGSSFQTCSKLASE